MTSTWRETTVGVDGREYVVLTKPGVFAHDAPDPSSTLLARHVAHTTVAAGDVVVQLHCRNGLFGAAAAAAGAQRVLLADRSVVAVEAARRTLQANGADDVVVAAGHGSLALPADVEADVVAIRIPREKAALLQLLHDAFRLLRRGGRLYVAGATNEGVKSAAGVAGRIFGTVDTIAHGSGHRVLLATKQGASPATPGIFDEPWLDPHTFRETHAELRGVPLTVCARPGVFSWDHVDEATTLLAEAMDVRAGESVLDLGCGAGTLGVVAAALSRTGSVCMVDADVEAVRSAERTCARSLDVEVCSRVEAIPSDGVEAVADRRFDVVLTNPPFHVGRGTDLDLPLQFIRGARDVLAPDGRMLLVANRTLPYENAIRDAFGNVAVVREGARFKVLRAEAG